MLDDIKIEECNKLVKNIKQIVASAQSNIAKTVNKTMIFTYWNIGKYIVEYKLYLPNKKELKQLLKQYL